MAEEIKEECITEMGFFISPRLPFSNLAERAKNKELIIEDLGKALKYVEEVTLGSDSEEDFAGLLKM